MHLVIGGTFLAFSGSVTAIQIVPLYLSNKALPYGLYGVVQLGATPFPCKYLLRSELLEATPQSE